MIMLQYVFLRHLHYIFCKALSLFFKALLLSFKALLLFFKALYSIFLSASKRLFFILDASQRLFFILLSVKQCLSCESREKKTKVRPDYSSAPSQLALCLRLAYSDLKGESCYALP
jgi:hypothetical protein